MIKKQIQDCLNIEKEYEEIKLFLVSLLNLLNESKEEMISSKSIVKLYNKKVIQQNIWELLYDYLNIWENDQLSKWVIYKNLLSFHYLPSLFWRENSLWYFRDFINQLHIQSFQYFKLSTFENILKLTTKDELFYYPYENLYFLDNNLNIILEEDWLEYFKIWFTELKRLIPDISSYIIKNSCKSISQLKLEEKYNDWLEKIYRKEDDKNKTEEWFERMFFWTVKEKKILYSSLKNEVNKYLFFHLIIIKKDINLVIEELYTFIKKYSLYE